MDQQIQPLYFPLLDDPIPPGVRNLQVWIENAWNDGVDDISTTVLLITKNSYLGFDVEGARQLKHKLVNTKKWIGTAGEVWRY